jgi:hypothetical protein
MARNTFDASIEGIKSVWGPLSTEVVAACRGHLEDLLKAPATEDWLAALHREAPANQELYRDPTHGFVLLAHTEPAGLYRPPTTTAVAGSSMRCSRAKSRWAPTAV